MARAAPATPVILGEYTRTAFWQRRRRLVMFLIGFAAFFYGAFFAVTTTYLLLQLVIPLMFLALMVVWLLPETGRIPERLLENLFFGFFVALLCWPDYLALALPGLPWITAVRLIAVPLLIVFLLALSQSAEFRAELRAVLATSPAIWKLLVAFSVLALLSVAYSSAPGQSFTKFVIAMLYWVMFFFLACWVFTRPGRAWAFTYLLLFTATIVCLIGVWEARLSAVPWAGHIPSFLVIQDESVQRILGGARRAATGIYRVQSKFTTPLGLAEFLALAMPFTLHLAVYGKTTAWRTAGWLIQPLALYIIVLTDARLGMVGFFSTSLLFWLFWAVQRWRRVKDSIFGPATVLAFPAVAATFLVATFMVHRLKLLVWGGGAQSYSTESRMQQVASGMDYLMNRPWGYGLGRAADTLGFRNGADVLTIDTYYLAMALDLGVIGFLVYYAIFIVGIVLGMRTAIEARDEIALVGPATIALINFVIIKSIFSQLENHPLVFALLGLVVALAYRARREAPETDPSAAPA